MGMQLNSSRWCVVLILCLYLTDLTSAGPTGDSSVDYHHDVRAVLRERCFACHGALKQESGLRLDTVKAMREGGDSGPSIEANDSANSLLIYRVTASSDDERMPPEGKPLAVEQIAAIRQWIDSGAPAPADDNPEDSPKSHWAFIPPVAADVPSTASEHENPIDAFLYEGRSKKNFDTVPVVEKSLLLRRVYLDLLGLPPTLDEMRAFTADKRADAYERVVDEILESPHYGERWGRHWMDVWRYSDWYGLGEQLRYSQKHIWRWRDWIVESLNEDLGYDVMVQHMLAGDEIAPHDDQVVRATGFLARNYYLFNRTTWLDGTIEHASKAFLGLTINCAKCHDHKYDPITHEDYYRLRAIFEPHQIRLDPVEGQTNLDQDGLPRAFDAHPDASTYLHIRGNEKEPDKSAVMVPATPEFFDFAEFDPKPVALPVRAYWPSGQPFVLKDQLEKANAEAKSAGQRWSEINTRLDNSDDATTSHERELLMAKRRVARLELRRSSLRSNQLLSAFLADQARMLSSGQAVSGADRRIAEAVDLARQMENATRELDLAKAELALIQAEPKNKAAAEKTVAKLKSALQSDGSVSTYESIRASRKALEGPAETEESRYMPYPRQSTGRRTAFAHWITHRNNPLTSRVAVNHIWTRHFGQSFVDPVTDFGRRARTPQQQRLMDWLAVKFMENGWRMKWLHRMIVTSQAYRLSSNAASATPTARESDPDNEFYWHRKPFRMESQVIRDSLISLAGKLDTKIGGPSVNVQTSDRDTLRRSIYFKHSRDDHNRFLSMFDDASIFQCYRREESVVPQQALALANSKLALEMARHISTRIHSYAESEQSKAVDVTFIRTAFELVLCRLPTSEELDVCQDSLVSWRQLSPPTGDSNGQTHPALPREYMLLVHSLINHNDFVTVR